MGPAFQNVWSQRVGQIRCGPYQRLFSTASGSEQAQVFIAAFSEPNVTLTDADLPPVLDAEPDPDGSIAPAQQYLAAMDQWIEAIQQHFKRRPIIYTNPSTWKYLGYPDRYKTLRLWIAHYGVPKPTVPKPWTSYTFWQYEQDTSVDGVSRSVDLDCFDGDATDLQSVIEQSKVLQ